jgi:Transglutaminase-like superfamily
MLPLCKLVVPRFERLLLMQAWCLLGIARIGLGFCHFQRVRRLLLLIGDYGHRITRRRVGPGTLLWAMESAKRKSFPLHNACLIEALTAEALFKQYGHDPVLCIGAAMRDGKFAAHAWLEVEQAVLVGGPESFIEEFTRFPDFVQLL